MTQEQLAAAVMAAVNEGSSEHSLLESLSLQAEDRLTRRQRRLLRIRSDRQSRRFSLALIRDLSERWLKENPDVKARFSEDSDTPWLDFLRELIDEGKFMELLQYIFENLPTLIERIVSIFVALP